MPSFKYLFLLTIALFLFSSCKEKPIEFTNNAASFGNYIQSYGPVSLSKQDEIFINFKNKLPKDFSPTDLSQFVNIKPSIKASYKIEDGRTFFITPTSPLESDKAYKISFDVKSFFNANDVKEKFEFHTQVKPQFANLDFGDYFYENGTWNLDVKLKLNDIETLESLRSNLQVTRESQTIDYSIIMDNPYSPIIRVNNVNPENSNDAIKVSFDAKKIGGIKKEVFDFEIPQQKTLELLETKEDAANKSIYFIFNKQLSTSQDLTGYIKIKDVDKSPKYLVKANSLIVFYKQSTKSQDVTISKGIKAIDGDKLETEIAFQIGQTEIKPAVFNVGLGHIIPTQDEIIYPFEAVGLNKVKIEVFQIHSVNLSQFYQRSNLQRGSQLEYIGEVVHNETVNLKELSDSFNPFEKKRYHFNLKNIARKDPNAIYEIRIGFVPEDVIMECANSLEAPDNNLSIFRNSYRGIYGNYNDFSWNDRDNPCKKAFYNNENYVKKLIVNTNIGIIVKKSSNGDLIVFANDLNTTNKIAGAEVVVYNKAQRELIRTKTDQEGRAFLKDFPSAYLIEVKKGIRSNWLRVRDNDGLSLSKFKVGGIQTENGLNGFIYAERDVWRPGDTMYVDFIVHDPSEKLPDNHPVEISLTNPQGKKVYNEKNTFNAGPFYSFAIPTSTSFLTGNYRIEAKLGTNSFVKYVKVETIKPNKFSIKNNSNDIEQLSEKIRNGKAKIDFDIQWLYGAPAKNKKLKIELDLKKKRFNADGYSDYDFSDPRNKFSVPPREVVANTETDDTGKATVDIGFSQKLNPPGLVNMVLRSTAFESSGDFSTGISAFEYSPYTHYVGVEIPKNQYNYNRVNKDQEATFNFISLDENQKPTANRNLSVEIYRMKHYWWYNSYDDNFDLANSSVHVSENSFDIKSGRNGASSVDVSFLTYGRYYIQACDEESGHCTGGFLYVGYPWNTEGMNRQVYEDAAQLNFKSTKESYPSGETVELNVPSYFNGRALVSLENGSTVVESFWTKVQRGNNKIKFTAQANMFPTIYAHVTLLQAHEDKTTDMPIRCYGVIPITIEDDRLQLTPEIIVKDELKPKEEFEVTIKEEDGKEMYYTLAVVDEGLLNFTNFKTPDPMSYFYDKPALGVRTIDMYNDVMSYYGKDIDQLFSIGGDGFLEEEGNEDKANRFKSVVKHIGPFYLRAGAQNKHQLSIPNYIGNVRFMLVAANENDYGFDEKNVPVKQDLMVLTTLPRTLAPGDKVDVPLTIFTMKDNIGNINYTLESSGAQVDLPETSGSFNSLKSDEKLLNLAANVGKEEGVISFRSTAKSANLSSFQDIEIQVENPNPIIRRTESFFLEGGKSKAFTMEQLGVNDSEYSIAVSTLAPVNAEELMDNLLRYPYGCLEQRTAAAYAAIYHQALGEGLMDEAYANQLVVDHISILYRFKQTSGYSLWPGSRRYDGWLTSFLGDFLLDAKARGYGVNKEIINQWVKDQKSIASNWNPTNGRYRNSKEASIFAQAYRLFTLAKSQNPSIGDMNRLREDYDLDYNAGLLLAAAYAEAGRMDIAEKIYETISKKSRQSNYYRYSYGSTLRNSALRILLYDKLKKENELAQEMKYLSEELEKTSYLSTHTASFVLRAISCVSLRSGFSKNLSIKYTEAGKITNFNNQQGSVNLEGELYGVKKLSIENIESNGVYVQLTRRAKEDLGKESVSSKSIEVSTVYVDAENKTVDVKDLEKGTDFIMVTTVSRNTAQGVNLSNIALRQAIPSGWEIMNDRITDSHQTTSHDYDYQDIRDSKVHTFFDLTNKESVQVRIKLKATYAGSYYQPKILAESMYTDQVYAEEKGFRCIVR